MTPEQRKSARERCAKAKQGPWRAFDRNVGWEVHGLEGYPINEGYRELFLREDAEFIAHARTDLPGALDALEAAEGQLRELAEQTEFDRTTVTDVYTAITGVIKSRRWITIGRGPYEWDDDRYRGEFKAAIAEIEKACAPLAGIRANLAGCPRTQAEVVAARVDLKAKLEAAEGRIAELKRALEASESFRKAYQSGKYKLYSMGGDICEAAAEHLPCSEGPLDRVSDAMLGVSGLKSMILDRDARIERLRAALEFYAKHEHWMQVCESADNCQILIANGRHHENGDGWEEAEAALKEDAP
jgi:hypothetical protein